jgi:SnoaL-like polyketide cyclase
MSVLSEVGEKQAVDGNLNLMKTLDDAWNAGPNSPSWETFRKRHTENVAVYWPGGARPTIGRHNHDLEAVEFFKTFPDNHLSNNPYKIFFGQGDYTCTVADFSGTMKGSMKGAGWQNDSTDQQEIPHRILHRRPLEQERRNPRRTTVLRLSRHDEADWLRLDIPTYTQKNSN